MISSALFVLLFTTAALAQGSEKDAPIISQKSDVNPDGSYSYSYETGNGINAAEIGNVKTAAEGEAIEAQGYYQYTSPEGKQIVVQYTANENGYQPQGEHLPTPPPVPAAIQKALDWILAHPSSNQE